jgi:hypothetical protein
MTLGERPRRGHSRARSVIAMSRVSADSEG